MLTYWDWRALEDQLRAMAAFAVEQANGRIREHMAIERLTEKLKTASGVAARATQAIEARADALIAREAAIDKRTDEVFAPHEHVLTTAEKGLDEAEAALRLLSNDPLAGSTSGAEGGTTERPLANGGAGQRAP